VIRRREADVDDEAEEEGFDDALEVGLGSARGELLDNVSGGETQQAG
jgi:hypothetical protein